MKPVDYNHTCVVVYNSKYLLSSHKYLLSSDTQDVMEAWDLDIGKAFTLGL